MSILIISYTHYTIHSGIIVNYCIMLIQTPKFRLIEPCFVIKHDYLSIYFKLIIF